MASAIKVCKQLNKLHSSSARNTAIFVEKQNNCSTAKMYTKPTDISALSVHNEIVEHTT